MTVPDGGGRTFILTPGNAATLLTQNAPGPDDPATVISSNVAGCRVYLSSDGAVSPSNGVPLDPGSSTPWTKDGTLYALPDPAGTAPATVTLTRAVDDWQPSPAAIAAQVAAQLLAQGVPSKLLFDTIEAGVTLPVAPAWSSPIDVSGYASLVLDFQLTGGVTPYGLGYRFLDPAGGVLDFQYVSNWPAIIPVVGPQIQLQINGTLTGTADLYGTNRASLAPHWKAATGYFGEGFHGVAPGIARTVGTVYALAPYSGEAHTAQQPPTGQCWMFVSSTGTVVGGHIDAVTTFGSTIRLCDTAELVAASDGSRSGGRMVVIPENVSVVQFTCTVAGTNTISCWLAPV